MGAILGIAVSDLGPNGYARKRSAKRLGVEADPAVRLFAGTIKRFGYAATTAGFEPGRVCRLLGYEVDTWPVTEDELAAASTLSDDGRSLAVAESEWLAEAARAALSVYDGDDLTGERIGALADVCDTAVLLAVDLRLARQ